MDRTELVKKLDKVTDKAASIAISRGIPIPNKKQGSWVCNTLVKKNSIGLYDIYTLSNELIFTNISTFDVAVIISQRYSTHELKTIEKVLVLDEKFSKYHTDMLHYLHCMSAAKRRKDYDTMAILEDKFQLTEIRARNIRDNIAAFKRSR